MRVVLDTNVLMSALFFGGIPGRVLDAWRQGRIEIVVSPLVLTEYRRVASELSSRFAPIDVTQILDLITVHAFIVEDRGLTGPICRDADDDVFLACAAAAGAKLVSGDKDLRAVDGALGVRVLTPRALITLLDD